MKSMIFLESPPQDIDHAILWALCGLIVAMGGALVWVIKNRKEPKQELVTGDTKPEEWHKRFDDMEDHIEKAKDEQLTAMRDLTKAINELTMTLLRNK